MYKLWTIEEELKLESLLDGGLSYKEIGIILFRHPSACRSHGRSLGLNSSHKQRKYTFDESFWSVPNALNSYWAGFSAADACVRKKTENAQTYKLEISKSDIAHLESLKSSVQFTGPISFHRDCCSFCISSTKWFDDLGKHFLIVPNKTNRISPPNLEGDLMSRWVIGYIDGDGTIHYNHFTDQLNLNIVSNSEQLIKFFKSYCDSKFPRGIRKKVCNYRKIKGKNAYVYSLSGMRAAISIDFLSKIECPKLQRKWAQPLVLNKIDEYKEKYPAFFTENSIIS